MILQTDTLAFDSLRVEHWQSNPAYDYNRELLTPDVDLLGVLSRWINDLLELIFGNRFAEEYGEHTLALICIAIVLLLLWFLYRKRPELFVRSRRVPLHYTLQEDTIYGVDFDAEIARSLARSDYREAIRLLYLQTLKMLSDRELIEWQPYKTPTEYLYEVKGDALQGVFRQLTNSFLRIRYGNFEATEELYRAMCGWQARIREGGKV